MEKRKQIIICSSSISYVKTTFLLGGVISSISNSTWKNYDDVELEFHRYEDKSHYQIINGESLLDFDQLVLESLNNYSLHSLLSVCLRQSHIPLPSHFERNMENEYSTLLLTLSEIESLLECFLDKNKSGVVILRDILHDKALLRYFPIEFIDICKFLFLPSYLNFRNLLWHGFMIPSEIPQAYTSFFNIIKNTLVVKLSSAGIVSNISNRSLLQFIATYQHFNKLTISPLEMEVALQSSAFVPTGFHSVLVASINDFNDCKYIPCLCKVLPPLEHSLRIVFSICNGTYNYLIADQHSYFSTLDGFGQRSKHQLLLDTHVHTYGGVGDTCPTGSDALPTNNLIGVIGEGLYSFLVDLFFTSQGPNLRALLAHGEIDFSNNSLEGLQHLTSAILVLVLALLRHFDRNSDNYLILANTIEKNVSIQDINLDTRKNFCEPGLSTISILLTWESKYHCNKMLANAIMDSTSLLFNFFEFASVRNDIRILESRTRSDGESESKIMISQFATIWESDMRITKMFSKNVLGNLSGFPILQSVYQMMPADNVKRMSNDIVHVCVDYVRCLQGTVFVYFTC